jgi:outer membrane protein TolC
MADRVTEEARARLEARLDELRPALEEADRIQAALAALKGHGPRPPVTALDTLKPVPEPD